MPRPTGTLSPAIERDNGREVSNSQDACHLTEHYMYVRSFSRSRTRKAHVPRIFRGDRRVCSSILSVSPPGKVSERKLEGTTRSPEDGLGSGEVGVNSIYWQKAVFEALQTGRGEPC